MDPGMEFCGRHGTSPGGGICAVCLQEKLILLWRGEGQNANWGTEEFCVTPPPVLEEEELQQQQRPELEEDDFEPRVVGPSSSSSSCFPFRWNRVKKDVDLGEREKIDRSQFSCELKSILKELAALHDKKKRRSTGTDRSENSSARRPPHHHHDEGGETEAVPRAKASVVEEDEEEEEEARYRKVMCFSAMWPAILNMKWARVVVSPILSSNKIAPSKSDLVSKVEPQRQESGRNCETSGSEQHLERAPTPALLPPQYHPADNEDGGQEMDKETKQRMEASRITVMTWLQSLPSPKAVHLEHHNLNFQGIPDDLSLGNGVLEMCDEEEEVEFDDHRHSLEIDVYAHMASFGKFLQSSPQIAYAPPHMVDIEIAAQ